jgi:hypothetical protein
VVALTTAQLPGLSASALTAGQMAGLSTAQIASLAP